MDELSKPTVVVLLIGFLAMLALPVLDQANKVVASYEAVVIQSVEEQGRYRFWDPVVWVKLPSGKRVHAEIQRDMHRSAMPGDSIVVLEYRSAVLGRHIFRVQR